MLKEPVEAVLFDMDGLLLDTERLYIEAMQKAAKSMNREMSLAFCHSMVGVPMLECNAMIQELYGPNFSIADFRARYSPIIREMLAERVPVKPGVVELLDFIAERGLRAAVATSAHRAVATRHLEQAGLLARFGAVATRDDVANPKPAPDLYLEAARRLGVAPRRCIAFEDSSIGLLAAHAAGTRAYIVPDLLPPSPAALECCAGVLSDLHAALAMLRTSLS